MPYKSEKLKIANESLDRRVKLTKAQRKEIVEEYATGTTSQRKLATKYKVSRRLIQFILDPDKKKRDLERRAARGGSKQYYDREKNNVYNKTHRDYKQKLYKKGLLDMIEVKVTLTSNYKFRAIVMNNKVTMCDVIIGSEAWRNGVGKAYFDKIQEACNKISDRVSEEYVELFHT